MLMQDGQALIKLRANSRAPGRCLQPPGQGYGSPVTVWDAASKDYDSRYNGSIALKPGKNAIDFDYTHCPDLVRSRLISLSCWTQADHPDHLLPQSTRSRRDSDQRVLHQRSTGRRHKVQVTCP